MYAENVRKINKASILLVISLGALCGTACQTPMKEPTPIQVAQMLEPNVTGVFAHYDAINPFIWTEDEAYPRGVVIKALYLQGPDGKGVFGDGIIRPRVYVSVEKPDGEKDWQLLKEWNYEVEKA
ncbi:MAG: hypothetical protein ACYTF1_13395, partial [Planctomycetota bacterium]